MCRIQNRSVTRTATQVAIKGFLNIVLGRCSIVPQQGVEAHHNAGGAEATLAAVRLGYALLSRMWLLCVADSLDGDDMLAVETSQGSQTGVHTGVVDLLGCGVVLADDDGASTATALSTAADDY